MVVVMKPQASDTEIENVIKRAASMGAQTQPICGESHTVIALLGDLTQVQRATFDAMSGVQKTVRIQDPYKLASRATHPERTIVNVNGVRFGDEQVVVMAGPCSVESREQIIQTAIAVKDAGASVLRGGAFKPRTSPYSFQGLGEEGLKYLAEAREITGLPVISEVMTVETIDLVAEYVDILQIGARNMQNYALLQAVGKTRKPVMLKRGLSGEIQELLMCAEYILSNGNMQVMLCERGIRTYETATRNTFDLNAIPVLKRASHLPVVADPAHGTGDWELVPPMSLAAVAAGADALILEVHPDPESALSDGDQSLKPERFADLMCSLRKVAEAVGRSIATPTETDHPAATAHKGVRNSVEMETGAVLA
ncbi:MAG: 3-deoxy-7-phosphoheptulonate synthase [Caldilineaceae bacterium]|nr:3-deoxy-7-phosphoheptulonate synthase [Caldilineaceae bacterium]MDE0465350.1 3-deoxy-7-phosphoheptulonate synthase [Caldilineaceae bacterium]